MTIARAIVRMSARLVPRDRRGAWREEWLGELHAAAARGPRATLRFALGAPRDAWATRTPARLFRALAGDFRSAVRQLARRPGHTGAVVACLVIGLTTSVAMWSVIMALFYGDMPGIGGRRALVRIYVSYDGVSGAETTTGGGRVLAAPYAFDDFRFISAVPSDSAVSGLGAEGGVRVAVEGRHGPLTVDGAFASGDFFATLRTSPVRGRLFDQADDRPDAPLVAVVTEHFWRSQLDGRDDAIGQPLIVGGVAATIVGVTPPRFHGMQILDLGEDDGQGVQVWLPLAHVEAWPARPSLREPWLTVTGRLRDGATSADVERQLAVAVARIEADAPAQRRHATPMVRPMGFSPTTTPFQVLAIIAVLLALPMTILAIGCANVANLQLARLAEQTRDLAVRLSLGATRAQLLRLLTIETLARTLVAVALSLAAIAAVLDRVGQFLPIFIAVDWRVLIFATALAVGIALITGLAPAWIVLRPGAVGHLKQNAQGGGLGHARLRGALVVSQVALSLGLLILTGLFERTVEGMVASAPAVLRHQIVASFDPGPLRFTPVEAREFASTIAERAAADPRVTGVSLSTQRVVNYARADVTPRQERVGALVGLTPSWLEMMGVKVLAGRALADRDDPASALVSARLAELIAPAGSALGDVLAVTDSSGRERRLTVVGVVTDNPIGPSVERPDPVIYVSFPRTLAAPFTLRVRAASDPEALMPDVRALIHAVDPRVTWTAVDRGDWVFRLDAREMSVAVYGAGAAGLIALLLSATGLFAVMSYVVELRRREIGIRTAIGAAPSQIAGLFLRQAIRLAAVGVAAGAVLGVPIALFMRSHFVARVEVLDPLAFGPPAILLFVVVLVAAVGPARRAARIDPISTLRQG